MRLKKIASVAMAGVLAISMLAGCNGGNANSNSNSGETDSTGLSVSAINNALDLGFTVNFTESNQLTQALNRQLAKAGTGASSNSVKATDIATLLDDDDAGTWLYSKDAGIASNSNAATAQWLQLGGSLKKVDDAKLEGAQSYYGVISLTDKQFTTDTAAVKMLANQINVAAAFTNVADKSAKAQVVEASNNTPVAIDGKYYTGTVAYTYTGEMSDVVAVENPANDTTTYFVVYKVTQNYTITLTETADYTK